MDRYPILHLHRRFQPHLQRLLAHHIRLTLRPSVITDRHRIPQLHRPLDAALRLLDDVPRLVRQMAFLPGRDVNVAALRVGQGVELRGPG